MFPTSQADQAAGPASESPGNYLGSSDLVDLEDSRLRLRARSLTQLCKTDREKAMALHNFVKKMPFERPFKFRPHSAREVLDAGRGDATGKAVLLVALLRRSRIPARIRYVELRGEILRGLTSSVSTAPRPVAEIWLAGHWVRTDAYIFDVAYMAAARQRLKDLDWEWGYGIHRNGQSVWNGTDDAFLGGYATENDPMVVQTLGLYDDPLQFFRSDYFRRKYPPLWRALHWSMLSMGMHSAVNKLRGEGLPAPQQSRRPS